MKRPTPSSVELECGDFKAVLHTFTIVEAASGANPNEKFRLSGLWTPEAAIEEVSRCFGVVPKHVSRVHHDTYVEGAFVDFRPHGAQS